MVPGRAIWIFDLVVNWRQPRLLALGCGAGPRFAFRWTRGPGAARGGPLRYEIAIFRRRAGVAGPQRGRND